MGSVIRQLVYSLEYSFSVSKHHTNFIMLFELQKLAAKSIAVEQNEKCKISDFTHLVDIKNTSTTSSDLTPLARWMAPESIANEYFSTASDVWSFGVVQWEMKNPEIEP